MSLSIIIFRHVRRGISLDGIRDSILDGEGEEVECVGGSRGEMDGGDVVDVWSWREGRNV